MSEIDLRFSDVDPPKQEPKRTIYRDINSMPNPMLLGLTCRIFNWDSVSLYFKIRGSAAGYTFTTKSLGILGASTDKYYNCDQFASREKPASALEEDIVVSIDAYTDAGYTILKWTFDRTVHVMFINSSDGSWTFNYNDNFDDGTVMGWASRYTGGAAISCVASTDTVVSPSYACRHAGSVTIIGTVRSTEFHKTITTPNGVTQCFLNICVREKKSTEAISALRCIITFNGQQLVYLGPTTDVVADRFPSLRWVRILCVLPANTTAELVIVTVVRCNTSGQADYFNYIDDVQVISK